ncbi:MAG: sodium/solute symporter [Mangrovibacterium sp.]
MFRKKDLAAVLIKTGALVLLALLTTSCLLQEGPNTVIDRNEPHSLSKLDWAVVVAYFILMVLIGVYYSKKNRSLKDFALGGKTMGSFSIGLSLFATMLSTLSYLSYPGEMIRYGPIIFTGMLAFPITHWVVGWYIIPKFMKEDVSSAYELLEKKLGVSIRLMASFLFISLRFLWMATIIFATVDMAIGAIIDVSPSQRFIFGFILLASTLVYSTIGGLKAVVMTDVIQTFLMWLGAILTIVIISINLGSFTSWIPDHWLAHWSPLKWGFDATERTTVGNAVLMLFVWYICTTGSDQMAIQRYLATRDVKTARRSFGIALLSNLVVKILLGLVGLALIGFFFKNPHLLSGGKSVLEQADSLFPRFIVVGFPVGIAGLVFAGLLAAAMSSLSGGLNSTAVVISEDWLKRFRKKRKSTEDEVKRIKLLSVWVGFIVLILSFVVGFIQGNLFDVVQKTANLFVAPLFVLFFMALFIPFSTEKGTFIAGLSSIFFALGVAYFEFMGIKSLWIMSASLIFGIVVGVIASYLEVTLVQKASSLKNRRSH